MESPAETPPKRLTFFDLLFAPIGCLIQMPLLALAVVAVFGLIGSYLYHTQNSDFWGLASHRLNQFTISGDQAAFKGKNEATWEVSYESSFTSEYTGLVRHISPFRMSQFPMLTHDILVSKGEFSDPALVFTSVSNHHFFWRSESNPFPSGKINLIHAVPENEKIYAQLLKIKKGDSVTITGREILKIEAFSEQGKSQGWWQDARCNTLLIDSVEINP